MKAGLRLTHLFYLPSGSGTWQLVLPSSFGVEYRLQPQSQPLRAGRSRHIGRPGPARPPQGRCPAHAHYRCERGHPLLFQRSQLRSDPWGNYLALEGTAELAQLGRTRPGPQSPALGPPHARRVCALRYAAPGAGPPPAL